MSHPITTMSFTRRPGPDLSDVMNAVGSDGFSTRLASYLHETCGADHCALFQIGHQSVSQVASHSLDGTSLSSVRAALYVTEQFWRADPAMAHARHGIEGNAATLVRLDIDKLPDNALRRAMWPELRERMMLAGGGPSAAIGLTVCRSRAQGLFGDGQVDRLRDVAGLLVAILNKHVDIVTRAPSAAAAVSSVGEAERCLVAMTELSRRELEVCARLVCGLSVAAIASDLSVGLESAKTYRKRAYQRLGLSSERELLVWYLDLWNAQRARQSQLFMH